MDRRTPVIGGPAPCEARMLLFLVLRFDDVALGWDFLALVAPLTVVLTSLETLLLIETANLAHSTVKSVLPSSATTSLSL